MNSTSLRVYPTGNLNSYGKNLKGELISRKIKTRNMQQKLSRISAPSRTYSGLYTVQFIFKNLPAQMITDIMEFYVLLINRRTTNPTENFNIN